MANIDNTLIHYVLKTLAKPENGSKVKDKEITKALFFNDSSGERWAGKREHVAWWPTHGPWYNNAFTAKGGCAGELGEEDAKKLAENQPFPDPDACDEKTYDKKPLYSFESHLLSVFNSYIQKNYDGDEQKALIKMYQACEEYQVAQEKLDELSKKTTVKDVVEYFYRQAWNEKAERTQSQKIIVEQKATLKVSCADIPRESTEDDFVSGKTTASNPSEKGPSNQSMIDYLKNALAPIRTSYWINEYMQETFIGREALIQFFDEWKKQNAGFGSNKALLVKGNLGTGKTALMVHLEQSERINTVFYCRRNFSVTTDPKNLIYFIADYLLENVPEYAAYWGKTSFPDDFKVQPTDQLICTLLSNPLRDIEPKQDIIIGVDALDEAAHNKDNQIKEALLRLFEATSPWLRFVITGRDTADIKTLVGQNQVWDILEANEKDKDMEAYLNSRLGPLLPSKEEIKTLVAKANGSFLYAKTICSEILARKRSLGDVNTFPVGMIGIYIECFNRLEGNGLNYAAALRPALEILAASYDPVSMELLGKMECSCIDAVCAAVELFPQSNGVILPTHSSVFEWLTTSGDAGSYYVNVVNGHKKLADFFKEHLQDAYALRYLTVHALEAGAIDQVGILLQDMNFQKNRFLKFGAEAIRAYLLELKLLSTQNYSLAYEVMTSVCFRELILGEYRKICFDYGYFFILSEAGFDEVLKNKAESWGYPVEAGIAFYKYATKTFYDAMPILESLLSSDDADLMDINEKAELSNMYALCLLKSSDYEAAKDKYKSVLGSDPSLIHQAEAHINRGKIVCYQQVPQWASLAKQSFDNAFFCIEEELCINYSQALSLKMADYYRISALYSGIWAGDIDHAEQTLKKAQIIYDATPVRARYHARYVYTNAALKIFKFEFDAALKDLTDLQNSTTETIKDYEQAQIAFFTALVHIMKDDDESACIELKNVLRHAGLIQSWVEYEEARTLLAEMTGKLFGTEDTSNLPGITYIKTWCQHIVGVINGLKSANDAK